jgi:hypothetical protein
MHYRRLGSIHSYRRLDPALFYPLETLEALSSLQPTLTVRK